MITGKELIDLGYKPSKWFGEAIDYANQNELSGDSLEKYLKSVAPVIVKPFDKPVDFYKNIRAEPTKKSVT